MDRLHVCPHCGKLINDNVANWPSHFWKQMEKAGYIVLDQMGHNWHAQCWEEFKKEYNDVLDSHDLNGKEGS